MKKILTFLVSVSLLLSVLAGCGSGAEVEYYDTDDTETAEAAAEEAPADTEAAEAEAAPVYNIMLGGSGYETYAPDTVIGTVAGTDVTWMEYYYWLNYYTSYYTSLAQQYGISLTSWDAADELSSEGSNADSLIEMTEYTIKQYHAVSEAAAAAGISLTEEDLAELDDVYNSNCDSDGDGTVSDEEAAAFEEYLTEQNVDKEFFFYLNEIALLSDRLFEYYYGEIGSECPDNVALQYIEDNGVMYAKHILLLTVDVNTLEPLDEDTIAQKADTAAQLYEELAAVQDDKEALIALFDEYMADYTEDTGYEAYPDGYVFVEGDMVEEFENAVKDLDENYALSEVVESPYGYHIILRQPITPDTTAGTNTYGESVTFRYAAAEQEFSEMISSWTDAADAQWNETFDSASMLAIFG